MKVEVREFIVENFLFGEEDDALTDEASFLETGIIDSTGILELISFVEAQFGIQLRDEELVPDNLDSLRNVSRFVVRKQTSD